MKLSTKRHRKYWSERKIDWKTSYLDTWDHPHRALIVEALKTMPWVSLWEVGCGPGANLVKITKELPGKQLGGSDVNEDAIELARKVFLNGLFRTESAEDLLMSDRSVDVILSDAALIYIDPRSIHKVMNELTRVARNHLVLCEFHSGNWFKRWFFRLKTGYNAYNYRKLLEKHGCYDISVFKIPKEVWPGTPWQTWGHIIICRVSHI